MPLHIYDARERALVQAADAGLRLASRVARPFRRRERARSPQRILVLRLERIGDLLMILPALRDLRALAEGAAIDLVVGQWNLSLARAIPFVTRVEVLSPRWLERGDGGRGLGGLLLAARPWRSRHYDLAINFEPDIRSNLVLAAAGARWCAGWSNGGGGPLLDLALELDPRAHTSDNARRLVSAVFEHTPAIRQSPLLVIPEQAAREADATLKARGYGPLVGIHASGGREVKQWEPEKFAEVAARLARERNATIVLTGAEADRAVVDVVKAALPASVVIDASGNRDLIDLAALIERLQLLVTGDTGPMHLAAALGTPVVAVFGPSDPVRYAPGGPADRIVRVDLPCSPCNRIRLPPRRCTGHTPDCLAYVSAASVFDAAVSSLAASTRPRAPAAGHAPA